MTQAKSYNSLLSNTLTLHRLNFASQSLKKYKKFQLNLPTSSPLKRTEV